MTSVIGYNFRLKPGEQAPPWDKLAWNESMEHGLYRDWATYYFNRRRENLALHYFDEAMKLDPSDYMTLYRRSQNQRKAARIELALNDATQAAIMALKEHGPNCKINLQICDALFELNKFEFSYKELEDNLKVFIGVKAQSFMKRLCVLNDVIEDVTGKSMSLFFLRNQKMICHVDAYNKAKAIIDPRILWKKLRDQEKCDVNSILEEEEEYLSPMEIERRRRAFYVINQTYINDSWYDVVFMKNLRTNPNLLLEQCKGSSEFLGQLVTKQYAILKQFMKMLQSRNPLYYVSYLKYPNKKMLEKNKEANLFRVQYQTHRNMIADLKQMRKLRKEKRVKDLSTYVERVMGDYYVLKTKRVMCWKFEFICEVYNILGLALSEQYRVPKNVKINRKVLLRLFHLPEEKFTEFKQFVFGDRSTYQEGAVDREGNRIRILMSRLEKRIRFAKYPIEKCYLYHKMSDLQLKQVHYDECCFNARRCIKESRECNSFLWNFLALIQTIKANVLQQKLEKTKDELEKALSIAQKLKSRSLISFIEACQTFNESEAVKRVSSIGSRQGSVSSIAMRSSRTSILLIQEDSNADNPSSNQ